MKTVLMTLAAALFALCLTLPNQAQDSGGLSVKKSKNEIEFYSGSKLITKLNFTDYAKPIFYPVHAPCGVPLTRGWPMVKDIPGEATDHPHQKSAWFCHGDVVAEGVELKNKRKGIEGTDLWAEFGTGCGKMIAKDVQVTREDKDHITVIAKIEWMSADGEKILDETRTIHIYQLEGAWLIVNHSDLFASVANIVFADTKEGAFAIRINEQLAGKKGNGKGKIQNADGKEGEKACWGHLSNWCDYSGPINGKAAGLAILADPKNPSPSCWHVREYGLMAANPFGRAKSGFPAMKGKNDVIRLEKGQHLRLRYGMLLHDGDADAGRVAAHYEQFVKLGELEGK